MYFRDIITDSAAIFQNFFPLFFLNQKRRAWNKTMEGWEVHDGATCVRSVVNGGGGQGGGGGRVGKD